MNIINRGVTSTHTFSIPYEKSAISEVIVYYVQGGVRKVTKAWAKDKENDGLTVEDGKITVHMFNRESLRFVNNSTVKIQIRIKDNSGRIVKSDVITRKTDEYIGG